MREITLKEYVPSAPISLTHEELVALRGRRLSLSIEPTPEVGMYQITPGSIVGAVEIDDMSVLVRPKIPIVHLLSLASYAMSRFRPQAETFSYPAQYELPDVLALALSAAARRAFSRGLLHGYTAREESKYKVRGRIRVEEQMRRRYGIGLPLEVRYDEYTGDIVANRLVKAAVVRLSVMRLRGSRARRELAWIKARLGSVSLEEFPGRDMPEVIFDRLNEHYRPVVELSRLILRHSAYGSSRGDVRARGFLMDMNEVFQEFVTVVLREELRLTTNEFRERRIDSLDVENRIILRPDLVWRRGSSNVFVGDAKYKDITGDSAGSGDLYQLLAYVTALDLPGGMLVYAAGETEGSVHELRHSGRRLVVASLDISGSMDQVLERVRLLAGRVRDLASLPMNPRTSGRQGSLGTPVAISAR